MSELYWITRLDGIHEILYILFCIFVCLTIAAFTGVGIMIIFSLSEEEDLKDYKLYKPLKWNGIVGFILSILLSLGSVFIPTTKEACMIYLGGSVLDYVQGSEKLNEVPDKVVNLATSYLDELIEHQQNNKKNKQEE